MELISSNLLRGGSNIRLQTVDECVTMAAGPELETSVFTIHWSDSEPGRRKKFGVFLLSYNACFVHVMLQNNIICTLKIQHKHSHRSIDMTLQESAPCTTAFETMSSRYNMLTQCPSSNRCVGYKHSVRTTVTSFDSIKRLDDHYLAKRQLCLYTGPLSCLLDTSMRLVL